MKLKRIVKLIIKKENEADFEKLFHKNATQIRLFKGCEHVELLKAKATDNKHIIFFTYSIWDNEYSLNEYRNSDFFGHVWNNTKKLFGGKPEAWSTFNN